MVAQSHHPAPFGQSGIVEGAPAHLGTEGTGVALFADVEDHLLHLGLADHIGHLNGPAEIGNRGKIHSLKSHVQCDGRQLKTAGIKPAQLREQIQQGQRVFAPRDPYRHPAAGRHHIIILHTAPSQRQKFFHF